MFFVFLYPRIDIIIGNTILFSCFFIRQFVSQTIFDNLYFFIMCYVSTFHCIALLFKFFAFFSFFLYFFFLLFFLFISFFVKFFFNPSLLLYIKFHLQTLY